jgi:glycosyltransferase involved in cell wall biosynthesis
MAAANPGNTDVVANVSPPREALRSGARCGHPRVVMVGPVIPYRGGIAQHTTMLHQALGQVCECLTVSFVRQYPGWLYPGETDRVDDAALTSVQGVEFLIDSLNPLSWEKAIRRIDAFDPDIVVFPWWHVYWAPCFWWLARRLASPRRELVFMVHNADDHESARWKQRLTHGVLSLGQRFIAHSTAEQRVLQQRLPGRQVDFLPMPVFDLFPAGTALPRPRRARLELLFFGFVRPYKGLDVLLRALALLKGEDVFLSVVGESWQSADEFRHELSVLGIAHKVEWVGRYVGDGEVAGFFERCDWVVLPYRSATGSAVVPLAYHLGRPVIATRVGGLVDVVEHGQTGLLVEPGDPEALAQVVRDILQNRASHDPAAIRSACARMTWDGLAKAVVGDKATAPRAEPQMLRTHAIKDHVSRELKARKILNLVRAHTAAVPTAILDVGAGAGYIAQNLAHMTGARVCAVDVADERQAKTGYEFIQVAGVVLPYADRTFDLVISNHVIEHVGNRGTQLHHLKEIARTLSPDGILYLAVPNRWGFVEPHYRFPFLSWLPQRWANRLLRWTGKASHYDCRLLSRAELEALVAEAGLTGINLAMDAIREMAALENHRIATTVGRLPTWLVHWLLPWIPTHIYLCRLAVPSTSARLKHV